MALAPILLSSRGLTGWVDPTKIITGDLALATNVDFFYGHMLQKEGGTLAQNAVALTGSPSIVCGLEFWPTATQQRRIVATSTGTLYKDDMTGTFATTLKSGLVAGANVQMVEGGIESQGRNKKLFICNGNDAVQVLSGNGSTTSDIGVNAPVDWASPNGPSFLFKLRSAIAGGGNLSDPHRVYISAPSDHEDFTGVLGALSLSVFPGEGIKLVAGLAAMGKAYLWKYPRGLYYILDESAVSGQWYVRKITSQYGAANTAHAVSQIDESTVAFLSSAGDVILMTETPGNLTGVEFTNLTKDLNLRDFFSTVFDKSRLGKAQMRWYPEKLQLHILLAAIGSGSENRRLIIDFSDEKTRVHVSDKDVNESMWLELDANQIARPTIGDNIGFIRRIDQDVRTKEGTQAYTMYVQTVPTDFTDANPGEAMYKINPFSVKKNFYRLHLEYEVSGNYDLSVEILIDGVSKGTVTFNQGAGGSILPFILPQTLSGRDIRRRQREISGEGYYLALRIIDTSFNNPRIARAWVEFEPLEMAR